MASFSDVIYIFTYIHSLYGHDQGYFYDPTSHQFLSQIKHKPNSQRLILQPLCFALPLIFAGGVCCHFASIDYGGTTNSLKFSPTAAGYDNTFHLIQIVVEMLVECNCLWVRHDRNTQEETVANHVHSLVFSNRIFNLDQTYVITFLSCLNCFINHYTFCGLNFSKD